MDGDGELWLSCMRAGRWDEAWAASDRALAARRGAACWHLPRHQQHVWDGTPLAGRHVLVRCYHGLGDTLMMARYLPALRATAASVTLWAQPALLPLLRRARVVDRLLPLHDGTPEVPYDVDVESMELPHVFRSTPATLPRDVPYLDVEPLPRTCGRDDLAVGVVWRAGDWDASRNVPFLQVARLAAVRGVRLLALQRDLLPGERGAPLAVPEARREPLATARLMRALDLVISVDSMPAHLAGALGVPVWTLLPEAADWRWMEDREDSPWYPSMRLFRQRGGGWDEVIDRVAAALRTRVRARRADRPVRPVGTERPLTG